MNHGSLFSGIGGFDLAAEWMGWENQFHCEWNEFGQRILKHYWPEAQSYGDITKTDFTIWNGQIDILTGGFPCQPYSQAGKRLGKKDERHLWPEMLRAIREIEPRWIVGENVYGIVNWNEGMVFEEVQAQLEYEGYQVQPYILPAAACGAPHRRDRVWFVAYPGSEQLQEWPQKRNSSNKTEKRAGMDDWPKRQSHTGNASNSSNKRLEGSEIEGSFERSRKERNKQLAGCFRAKWQEFPTQSPVCNGNDGLSSGLDGITFPKWRNESIKGGGNAIVPQVALQIFKAIEQYEQEVK